MIRAKGHFWIATRPDWVAEFSLAGAISTVTPLGRWWAGVPRQHWPTVTDRLEAVTALWEEPWGDRRQELVFIGADMDKDVITTALEQALVDESDFLPAEWSDLPDPFPAWDGR